MDAVVVDDTARREGGLLTARVDVWASVAGIVVALALQMLLVVLGAAIGLSAFEPESGVAKGVGIGFLVWLLLSLCASAFVGAFIASTFARTPRARDGILHGLVLWAAVSLIGAMFVGGAVKGMLSGVFGVIGKGAQTIAQSPAAQPAQPVDPNAMKEQLGGAVDRAKSALAQPEMQRQVAEKADAASAGAAIGLWGVFFALLLPLATALFGGWSGARREARGYRVRTTTAGPATAVPRRRADDRPLGTPPLPAT